jgi:hypothetical protein
MKAASNAWPTFGSSGQSKSSRFKAWSLEVASRVGIVLGSCTANCSLVQPNNEGCRASHIRLRLIRGAGCCA